MKKNTKIIALALTLVIAVGLMIGAYFVFMPKSTEGDKTITVTVFAHDETIAEKTISTDAEFLRSAIEKELELVGTDSDFGMYVTEVCKIKADDSKNEWWCFSKDGEMLNTGIDQTPIADGESYEVTLSTY